MARLRHGHEVAPGVSCNDRNFEVWTLERYFRKDGKLYHENVPFQVYACPKEGARGAQTTHFKIVVDGLQLVSPSIEELREKATHVLNALTEENYEKVLVVQTTGFEGWHRAHHNEFGLEYQIGWRVALLDGVIFNEDRKYVLTIEENREDEAEDDREGFKINAPPVGKRGIQAHKTAVVPWTEKREQVLKSLLDEIDAMRGRVNNAMVETDFGKMLDSVPANHLLADPKGKP
jgi:hypothetical protein